MNQTCLLKRSVQLQCREQTGGKCGGLWGGSCLVWDSSQWVGAVALGIFSLILQTPEIVCFDIFSITIEILLFRNSNISNRKKDELLA